MNGCAGIRARLHPYLDGELPGSEVMAVEAHLLDCPACAAEYDQLRLVTDTVRGARPLYDVPPEVQDRARRMVKVRRIPAIARIAAAAAVLVALAALLVLWRQRDESGRFTAFAADTHRRYASSLLPLDLISSQPEAVNQWLERRVPFRIVLPNYPARDNTGKPYRLHGTRLVHFDGHDAALVAYEMSGRPISLLIASAAEVTPVGGHIVKSGALAFHFERHDGLQTIAWSDRGLSYALVSDVEGPGEKSCVVCHGSVEERQKFEGLRKTDPLR